MCSRYCPPHGRQIAHCSCNSALPACFRKQSKPDQPVPGGPEPELSQKAPQPVFALLQVRIVPESGQGAGGHSGLARIDLPRMQIKNEWYPVRVVDRREPPARNPIGQQPEVSATGDGNPASKNCCRCKRPLNDMTAIRRRHSGRHTLGVRNSITVMMDGKNA